MKKITFLICLLITAFTLSACMYRMNIQQGNVITPDMVAQLKPGMTQDQVRYVMGTPVLDNSLNPNRWDYVSTFQAGGGKRQEQHVTLFFANGILKQIQTSNAGMSVVPSKL